MFSEKEAKRAWIESLTDEERGDMTDEELEVLWGEMKQEVAEDDFKAESRMPKTTKNKRKMVKESRRKNRHK